MPAARCHSWSPAYHPDAQLCSTACNSIPPCSSQACFCSCYTSLQVLSALHMVLSRWKSEAIFSDMPDVGGEQVQLRMCMLGRLCGAVIGEAGKNINDIKSATNTDIRVQARSRSSSLPHILRLVIV